MTEKQCSELKEELPKKTKSTQIIILLYVTIIISFIVTVFTTSITILIHLENSGAHASHDPHADGHVGRVGQLDPNLCQRRANRSHTVSARIEIIVMIIMLTAM